MKKIQLLTGMGWLVAFVFLVLTFLSVPAAFLAISMAMMSEFISCVSISKPVMNPLELSAYQFQSDGNFSEEDIYRNELYARHYRPEIAGLNTSNQFTGL